LDPLSLELLANYCESGLLGGTNPKQVLAYRRAAAEAGSANAQYALGKQYEDGEGVEESAVDAAKWYQLAAAQNHTGALLRLISLLRNGAEGLPQDFPEAVRLARRGVELGETEAITNLADFYNRGEGVSLDYVESARLYREAANKCGQ
jgi:TPR repeat protein